MADDKISAEKPLSHRHRSGSENRKRGRLIGIRLTAEECAPINDGAAKAGLTPASYARELLVKAPKTRSRRRPLADVAELARLHTQLAKIGGNINQITRRVNFGETPVAAEFAEALSGIKEILAKIRGAMGYGD
jgi:hypothetical protein